MASWIGADLPHITVTCRCTRAMRQEPGRRAGYLMCSCGNRVRLDDNRTPVCVAPLPDGHVCPDPLWIREPVPLCKEHRTQLLRNDRFTGGIFTAQQLHEVKEEAERRVTEVKMERVRQLQRWQYEAELRKKALKEQALVYYVARGHTIKIGYTTNMRERMASVMPDAVLATEPGDRELESARHRQFGHLRAPIGREYFSVHPDLLTHIEKVLAEHGPPTITGYPSYDSWHLGDHMFVPAKTAAKLAGVSLSALYEWIREERLTVVRPADRRRGVLVNALEAQELAGLRKGGRLPRLDKAG